MDQRHLHKLLSELHTELLAARSVGKENRALLERLAADIRAIVATEPSAAPAGRYAPLRQRLAEAVVAFETSHPRLSKTIENVIDTLNLYNL
ncbi:MAG TPA: DUF4404 family protein [Gemmatimonadales bacterium]|nr:DUF4404 family protein [Gemmatimonadales bacterium]